MWRVSCRHWTAGVGRGCFETDIVGFSTRSLANSDVVHVLQPAFMSVRALFEGPSAARSARPRVLKQPGPIRVVRAQAKLTVSARFRSCLSIVACARFVPRWCRVIQEISGLRRVCGCGKRRKWLFWLKCWIVRVTSNQVVGGSSPSGRANHFNTSHALHPLRHVTEVPREGAMIFATSRLEAPSTKQRAYQEVDGYRRIARLHLCYSRLTGFHHSSQLNLRELSTLAALSKTICQFEFHLYIGGILWWKVKKFFCVYQPSSRRLPSVSVLSYALSYSFNRLFAISMMFFGVCADFFLNTSRMTIASSSIR